MIASAALWLDFIPLFYVGYGVIGGAGIGLGYVTPVATVAKWFPDMKGLVTGIVVMGFGVGALLLSKGLAPFLVVRTEGDLAMVFLWLGIIFAGILVPCSLALSNPGDPIKAPSPGAAHADATEPDSTVPYLTSGQFVIMWIVFFFNIAAGISVISFQSELLQEVWGLADPTVEPAVLAEYGATLIAASSVCNGVGRLFWGLLSDRIGRVKVFRILLASQMVVFGILMTEENPWVFSVLVCYVLLCFGGGFATMPPYILDVFGAEKMAKMYGVVLTAWAAAGIFGPLYVGYLKDSYPDRAVMYCFLIGILMLGAGYLFSYLLNDGRLRLGRPTLATHASPIRNSGEERGVNETMKFYDCSTAPSPRRVRIFIAEKGLAIPTVQVDLRNGEHLTESFRILNPWCTVPVLELDDGTAISEAVAVCRYLEDAHPEPPLMGVDARDRAMVAMWEHRFEIDGFLAVTEAFRNQARGLAGRALTGPGSVEQIPELVTRGRARVERFFAALDEQPRPPSLCRRRALHHRRYHGAGGGGLRGLDQDEPAARAPPRRGLVSAGQLASQRRRLVSCPVYSHDKMWRIFGVGNAR